MSNETYITVRGYAGADPVAYDNGNGLTTVVARVGVTARIRDRETHRYRDGTTSWYSVRCYGDLGLNVSRSVRRGTPVLVRGRLVERAWTAKDGAERTDLSIIADALGIELSSGVATFVKVRHTSVDSNGRPVPEARLEEGMSGGAAAAVTPKIAAEGQAPGTSTVVRGGFSAAGKSDPESPFDGVEQEPSFAGCSGDVERGPYDSAPNSYGTEQDASSADPAGVLEKVAS